MDTRAHMIPISQSLPGVLLDLFHAKTDAPRFWVDTQHFDLYCIPRIDELAWMLNALGPAHFGDVHQTLNARLKFYKRSVVRDACYFASDACVRWKSFFD